MNIRPVSKQSMLSPFNERPRPLSITTIVAMVDDDFKGKPLNDFTIDDYRKRLNSEYQRFCEEQLCGCYPIIKDDIFLSGFDVQIAREVSININPIFKAEYSDISVRGELYEQLMNSYFLEFITEPAGSLKLTNK